MYRVSVHNIGFSRMKENLVRRIITDIKNLQQPLVGKPALLSALVLILTIASIQAPSFAPLFLLGIAIFTHFVSRRLQWIIFLTLSAGILSLEFFSNMEVPVQNLPSIACGNVEATQPRSNGYAILINVPGDSFHTAYRIRLTEKRNLPIIPLPGDSICYEASWYPVTPPTVPGAFDTKGWLHSQRLAAYGKFKHWTIHDHHWIPERSFFAFRQWIKSRFSKYLDHSETGLLLGLLAGDRSGIPDALRSDFQRSGLVHVLAISGFHVVLLAGMLMIFLKATRLPHRMVRIFAVILLLVYIPVTGSSPAVRRAVLMFAVPQIGSIFQRTSNTLNSLGVALILLILPEPNVIWNPGFQLSVAATAGILISGPINPLKNLPTRLTRNKLWKNFQNLVLDPTYVTLCATLSTAPFLIHHFKTLSPFAWLGNIVVVPAISMGMQAGLFGLLFPIDEIRQYFCYAARFFLRLASLLTKLLSDSSQASTTVGPFGPAILLLCGFLILLIPAYRSNPLARKIALAGLLLFSLNFLWVGYQRASHPTWSLTTTDVGQGDSHLITTPSQKHILVDAGDAPDTKDKYSKSTPDAGKNILVPYLHHIGVSSLDALIITHADKDHFGGALSLIRTFPVKELWMSKCSHRETKPLWQQLIREANRRNIPIREIHRGFLWRETDFQLWILHPDTSRCTDENTQSITLRAKGLGHSALLTGDLTIAGEREILRTNMYLKSDVLKLGHHGSKTSSSRNFLQAVQPNIAIISSGRKNRFRHPHKQVVSRLDSLHIPYLNTAERGTIKITFSKDSLKVHTMLE